MSEKIDPFGGQDIVEVLKFYCKVFPENPVFKVALEEILRLRNEKKERGER